VTQGRANLSSMDNAVASIGGSNTLGLQPQLQKRTAGICAVAGIEIACAIYPMAWVVCSPKHMLYAGLLRLL
jgi:hypothetical protein